jgi:hypothetical protein
MNCESSNGDAISAVNRASLPAVLALIACLPATPAFAHAGERGQVLLLPTRLYILGGAAAVGLSFLVLALSAASASPSATTRSKTIAVIPRWAMNLASTVSFILLAFLLLAGFTGAPDPLSNPLPLMLWTFWWVGFTLLAALVGNVWKLLNPWSGPCSVILQERSEPPLRYPSFLGCWPAFALFLAFAWFELVYATPQDPARLAAAASRYALLTFIGIILFGRVWIERAEAFTVFFGLVSLLAPIRWFNQSNKPRGSVVLKLDWPLSALKERPPLSSSEMAFVLLALSTVSFDGLSRTFTWNAWLGINPLEFPGRSALLLQNTFGLALFFAILASAYAGAFLLGHAISRKPIEPAMMRRQVLSLLPIAIGFHCAHYLPSLLLDWKHALRALSDPFARGWDLLGTAGLRPSSPMALDHATIGLIYNLQTLVIVLAHVGAVYLTHHLAESGVPRGKALLAQLPMTFLMILYTIFGLWLLSTPVVG